MRVPTEAELAAIATAYLLVVRAPAPAPPAEPSRWRTAARTAEPATMVDAPAARTVARGPLWRSAGRV